MTSFQRLVYYMISVSFFVASCREPVKWYRNNFYNKYKDGEYRRLPLADPYYLKAFGNGRWDINFPGNKIYETQVDILAIERNNFIYGYGKNGQIWRSGGDTSDLITYFIIDLKQKKQFIYLDSIPYHQKLKDLSFAAYSLYDRKELDVIYQVFSNTGKLPWYAE